MEYNKTSTSSGKNVYISVSSLHTITQLKSRASDYPTTNWRYQQYPNSLIVLPSSYHSLKLVTYSLQTPTRARLKLPVLSTLEVVVGWATVQSASLAELFASSTCHQGKSELHSRYPNEYWEK